MTIALADLTTYGTLTFGGSTVANFDSNGFTGIQTGLTQNTQTIPTGAGRLYIGPVTIPTGQVITVSTGARMVVT